MLTIEQEIAELQRRIDGERAYETLIAELTAIERARNLYLVDENVDRENVELDETDAEFWPTMVRAASSAAGARAEEYGLDINALIGRVIY